MDIYHGPWAALMTPANDDGSINLSVLYDLIDYLIEKGIAGFYVGGTTGEGVFMSLAQRKQLTEASLRHIDGRVPAIIHVGAIAVADAVDLACHAQEQGAVGVASILPPLYDDLDSLYGYFKAIGDAIPALPVMPYLLFPKIDSVAFIRRLLDIPNLGGMKYTGPNMFEFRRLIEMGEGRWTMFSGMDEQCLYAAMMGSTGNVGSTLNFMPGVFARIHEYVKAGQYDEAQALQVRANAVVAAMVDFGFAGPMREVMAMIGFDCGRPRLPFLPLTDEQRESLRAQLEATDFRELVAL